MTINIRPTKPEKQEIAKVLRVHASAVRETAAPFYPSEVIEGWAAKDTPDAISKFQQQIEEKEKISFVAEMDGEIVGFGEILPQKNYLGAIYVAGHAGSKGVGSALVAKLFEIADDHRLKELHLESSINAEDFYKKHGFDVVERTTHTVRRSGVEMACVKMKKILQPKEA